MSPFGKLDEEVERTGVADAQVEHLLLGGDDVDAVVVEPVVELCEVGLRIRVRLADSGVCLTA